MRIGELAGFVGISTRTIRHYHRVGLLPEPARKPNGYREYSLRAAVERARVRRLTELGLSLDEVGDALAGDADECLALIAPDLVINLAELPEPQHGREVWRHGFDMMKHAFPDLQAHIEDIFGAQDRVAVRLRFRGTHSGEFLGFGATGRTVEYVSHEFYRIADGLIAEEWICSDMAGLFRQLS